MSTGENSMKGLLTILFLVACAAPAFGSALGTNAVSGHVRIAWNCDTNQDPFVINGTTYQTYMAHSFNGSASSLVVSTAIPTSSFYVLANNQGAGATQFQGCTLSAVAIGGAFTIQQYNQFLTDINVIENLRRQRIP